MASALTLIDKVRGALVDACRPGPAPSIELEDVKPGKVAGLVLSSAFAGKSPSERQTLIWSFLESQLSPSEQTRVVFIVTDTPEEHRALASARRAG